MLVWSHGQAQVLTVNTVDLVERVAVLARRIWEEYYPPLIGQAQVAYMLERFQSSAAISRALADGLDYRLVLAHGAGPAHTACARGLRGDRPCEAGYWAVQPDTCGLFLSKLYLDAPWRGRGLGRAMLAAILDQADQAGRQGVIHLTVNRGNLPAIAFYQAAGFAITGPVVTDLGSGFRMDDYRMERPVGGRTG